MTTSAEALARLKDGNRRFAEGRCVAPDRDAGRRLRTAEAGQHPFAVIVGCADSRVPVEIVLDAGIGDLFVVRLAGQVCGIDAIGSVEYAVGHLGAPLVVVLGHTRCGAVTAAATDAASAGCVAPLVDAIRPAVEKARRDHPDRSGADLIADAVVANVWQTVETLMIRSGVIWERVQSGRVQVHGALYSLETGEIQWLGERPRGGRRGGDPDEIASRGA